MEKMFVIIIGLLAMFVICVVFGVLFQEAPGGTIALIFFCFVLPFAKILSDENKKK